MGPCFWNQIKDQLKSKNPANKLFQTWIDPVVLLEAEDQGESRCFKLGVPSDLHRDWISNNFLDRIFAEISAGYGKPFCVELIVTPSLSPSLGDPLLSFADPHSNESGLIPHNAIKAETPRRDILNPDYSFSTFVVGRNNEFAHAACYNVALNPGEKCNPLFICGPTGLGKTHLLNAVGNHLRQGAPHLRICYVSAEKFLNECIMGIRKSKMDLFRAQYREHCDILLMDDVQILGRTEAVQDEFFHTLNDFFETRRQVVVASDRMPKDILGLAERIRTRLEWGLIADIQMPDIETRIAILKYKAEAKSLRVPEDVIQYIARISTHSIRELEGNLNKVKIYTELRGVPLTLDYARTVLAAHGTPPDAGVSPEEIQRLVAEHFKLKVADMRGASRARPLVVARQVAMLLIKKLLNKTLSDIGRSFGDRDHTTVLNALRRVEDQQSLNSDLKKDINILECKINNLRGM